MEDGLQLTLTISATGYLVTTLQAGLRGAQISRCESGSSQSGFMCISSTPAEHTDLAVHAYYALFASMGFLAPLSAVSLTANYYTCTSNRSVEPSNI